MDLRGEDYHEDDVEEFDTTTFYFLILAFMVFSIIAGASYLIYLGC